MLRALVVALALLAAVKLGLHAYFYRAATYDLIIETHAPEAISACSRSGYAGALRIPHATWSRPADVSLQIGKRALDVNLWQIRHRLWNARYRNPYIVITANAETAHIFCEYDIVRKTAIVQGL